MREPGSPVKSALKPFFGALRLKSRTKRAASILLAFLMNGESSNGRRDEC